MGMMLLTIQTLFDFHWNFQPGEDCRRGNPDFHCEMAPWTPLSRSIEALVSPARKPSSPHLQKGHFECLIDNGVDRCVHSCQAERTAC